MATLTISHYVYLDRDQRYQLHAGQPIEVVGVSVPVWFDRGTTSEPAQELFCKYKLTNEAGNKAIMPTEEGYSINLPQKDKDLPEDKEAQEVIGMQLGTSEQLLDVKDGGSEMLEFRQYNKVHKDKHVFNVVHFVEIKPDELLKDTLN